MSELALTEEIKTLGLEKYALSSLRLWLARMRRGLRRGKSRSSVR